MGKERLYSTMCCAQDPVNKKGGVKCYMLSVYCIPLAASSPQGCITQRVAQEHSPRDWADEVRHVQKLAHRERVREEECG